jgi:hypothetical protein
VLPAPAGAGWTPPVQISAPTSIEVLGPQIAASPTGAAAVSFNEVDIDHQGSAGTFLALASPHGAFRAARAVRGAQEVLAIAYSGSTLELLTASGPPGQPCCSTVRVIQRRAGSGFGRAQTLVTDVGGGATGRLVPLDNGRMLAMIAGPQRLWVTEANRTGKFGALRGMTAAGSAPAALAVTGTPGGGSAVVWTQGSSQSVFGASAGPGATPSRPRTLLKLPPGHAIAGLQIASRPTGLTLAWTESWNDAAGAYHARAMAADLAGLGKPLRSRALSAAVDIVSGFTLASDAAGDEVAAWATCSPSSLACTVQSRVRRVGPTRARGRRARRGGARWFGSPSTLGPIDPGESPQLTMSPTGATLIGWIATGRVVLASKRPAATHFTTPRPKSGGPADNLTLATGPTTKAIATWSEGTAPAVFVSVLR